MSLPRRRELLLASLAPLGHNAKAQEPTVEVLTVTGCRITLMLEPGFDATRFDAVRNWVRSAAGAVAGYLGRFPLTQFELLLQVAPGKGVKGGTTFGEPEPYIRVRLGQDSRAEHLADDWVLVHEMVHLALPRVPQTQSWLHEGVATYVEGAARVRAGLNTAPRLWAEWVRGMPQGQPQPGDRGLDHTPTWGRTYWGGALFCLQADLRLLMASQGRQGLREALQGVLSAGGSYAVAWPVRRILEVADQSVGQTTLMTLYDSMKESSEPVDLARLWRDLGVSVTFGSSASFDDSAPLAALRRTIA